jgi:transposase
MLRRLMLENNFPQIWVPSPENRDLRQLLWHRHRLVQMRTIRINKSLNSVVQLRMIEMAQPRAAQRR